MAFCMALYIRDENIRGIPIGGEAEDIIKIIKNNSFEEIKKEILEGGVENWFDEKNSPLEIDYEQKQEFEIRRPNDKILKEFGW